MGKKWVVTLDVKLHVFGFSKLKCLVRYYLGTQRQACQNMGIIIMDSPQNTDIDGRIMARGAGTGSNEQAITC